MYEKLWHPVEKGRKHYPVHNLLVLAQLLDLSLSLYLDLYLYHCDCSDCYYDHSYELKIEKLMMVQVSLDEVENPYAYGPVDHKANIPSVLICKDLNVTSHYG